MLSVYNCACLQEMSRCDECIFLLLLLVVMGFFYHLLSIYSLMRLKNKMCHLPSVPHTQTILEDEVDDPVYQVGP